MAAALKLPSESVVDAVIRSWRLARTSTPVAALGLSSDGMLGRLVDLGVHAMAALRGHRPTNLSDKDLTDADIVQHIVDRMPDEIRTAFEAYHLALIRGEWCHGWPHAARALTLGLPKATYFYRVTAGKKFIQVRLRID